MRLPRFLRPEPDWWFLAAVFGMVVLWAFAVFGGFGCVPPRILDEPEWEAALERQRWSCGDPLLIFSPDDTGCWPDGCTIYVPGDTWGERIENLPEAVREHDAFNHSGPRLPVPWSPGPYHDGD